MIVIYRLYLPLGTGPANRETEQRAQRVTARASVECRAFVLTVRAQLEVLRDAMDSDLAGGTFHSLLKDGNAEADATPAIPNKITKADSGEVMVGTQNSDERTKLTHGRPARYPIEIMRPR